MVDTPAAMQNPNPSYLLTPIRATMQPIAIIHNSSSSNNNR
jgi:hypothetical protein